MGGGNIPRGREGKQIGKLEKEGDICCSNKVVKGIKWE